MCALDASSSETIKTSNGWHITSESSSGDD